MLAFDGQKHLIEVPFVARARTSPPQLVGIWLTKLAAPFTDGLISHHYTSLQQYFFHVTEAQAEPKVQPHGVADNFHREAMVLIWDSGC
jgi:hypothetical protein